ncbi:MAG: hypothetical protein ACI4MJ_00600 [Aristaeellaceae bacterium]
MLRERNIQSLTWADKTGSMMRRRQAEAAMARLADMPSFSLFSDCDDTRAEMFHAITYDAMEHPVPTRLHTIQELRAQVFSRMDAEAALLTFDEHKLLERMLSLDGSCGLLHPLEVCAAESLVRRLWCTVSMEEDEVYVHLPEALLTPLTLIVTAPAHEELREKLLAFNTSVRAMLYIGGMIHIQEPLRSLMELLKGTYACDLTLARRFLCCEYDYTYNRRGEMLLLHHALAEPERLMDQRTPWSRYPRMNEATLRAASQSRLPEEVPSWAQMVVLLMRTVRPDVDVFDTVFDLKMLIKQGVSLAELTEVLSSALAVQPTPAILSGLRDLYYQTLRWGRLGAEQVQ